MKKLIKLGYTVLAMSPVAALAIPVDCPDELGAACRSDLQAMITNISNVVLLLVGVVAVLFLIIGGFQYIASGGNPEQVNKAKNTIFYAIIGIVVTLLAYVVVQFVVGQLT